MRDLDTLWTALPATPEWTEFRAAAPSLESDLARSLERLLTQDPRCPTDIPSRPAVGGLASDAFRSVLEEWEDRPTDVRPDLWLLKHAIEMLDAALDTLVETGGRFQDVGGIRPASLVAGRQERARWFVVAALANPHIGDRNDDDFTTGESREILRDVERALCRLPELRRRAVTHRFLDGLSIQDLSLLLDISEDDVEVELLAGVKLIQLELQPTA